MNSYQRRLREIEDLRIRKDKIERAVWKLQALARQGTPMGRAVSPYEDLEDDEEGPLLNEKELRDAIVSIKIF